MVSRGALVDTALLYIYGSLYTITVFSCMATTYLNAHNFYLTARQPQLLCIDLIINCLITVSFVAQQVTIDGGSLVPLALSNITTFVGLAVFMPLHLLKATRLVIVFSPQLRTRYGRHWTRARMLLMLGGCLLLCVALYIAAFFIYTLYLTLLMMVLNLGYLAFLIYYVKKLRVYDKIGIIKENAQLLGCIVFWFCTVLPLILNPGGRLPKGVVIRALSWLLIFIMACELFIVHLLPSIAHDYDPIRSLIRLHNTRDRVRLSSINSITSITSIGSPSKVVPVSGEAILVSSKNPANDHNSRHNRFKLLPAHDEKFIAILQEACRKFLCEESLLFLLEVNELQKEEDAGLGIHQVLDKADRIVVTYVKPGSEYEVNISSAQVHRCLEAYKTVYRYYNPEKQNSQKRSSSIKKAATMTRFSSLSPKRGAKTPTNGGAEGHSSAVATAAGGGGEVPAVLVLSPPPIKKVAPCFVEAFDEIEKMLSQNIMKYVETLDEYQVNNNTR